MGKQLIGAWTDSESPDHIDAFWVEYIQIHLWISEFNVTSCRHIMHHQDSILIDLEF